MKGKYLVYIGLLLAVLSLTGFNIDIPKFYTSLTMEGKILFWGIFNSLLIISVAFFLFDKIRKTSRKSSNKS